MFGHPSLVAGLPPTFSVRAFEDTICYLIERQVAEDVIGTRSGIEFLARGLARRSRQVALSSETERMARPPVPLSTVLHREAIGCAPTVSVREAATTMAREAISSILVRGDDLLGIVTDRDLRTKVVAEGRDLTAAVSQVMTSPVITVRDDAMADEALRLMLQHGIHHLPVTAADGRIVGVVSDTDLIGLERSVPFTFLRALDRAEHHRRRGRSDVRASRRRDPAGGDGDRPRRRRARHRERDRRHHSASDPCRDRRDRRPARSLGLARPRERSPSRAVARDGPGPRVGLRGIRCASGGGRCVLRTARATSDRRAGRGRDPSMPRRCHGRVRRVASGSGDVGADVPRTTGSVRRRRDGVLEHRARLPPGRGRARYRSDDRSAGADGSGRGMARPEAGLVGSGPPAPDGLLPGISSWGRTARGQERSM